MGEGESGSPSRAELVWVYHGLDNRWEGFESTTLCQGWTDPAAEAKWNNYFFRPGTEACAGADSETASYQLSVSERHSDTWLLNRSALCQASHCPSGMAEGMFLECTVPAWLLQYHGTFSDTLENCQLQWTHNKIIQFIEIAWKINVRIAFLFVLGFSHLWEYLFVLEMEKYIKHKKKKEKKNTKQLQSRQLTFEIQVVLMLTNSIL